MIDLDSDIWIELEGGYRVVYDASTPLKRLKLSVNADEQKEIWEELWNELHHQGDVGVASYLAVPQLVKIARKKGVFDWNILGLCGVIEQQRLLGDNPKLPEEFQDYYDTGLADLQQFVLENLGAKMDNSTYALALSTLATCNGRVELGKAIAELQGADVLAEFLENF